MQLEGVATTAGANGHRRLRDPIAIIGLGCVLPDAPDVPTFWRNLAAGRCSITEVPRERWDPDLFWSPDRRAPDRTYSKIGAFVRDFRLDPRRFRVPPRVLAAMDAAQLWALAAVDEAWRDAGYDTRPFDRDRCAVILGATGSEEVRTPTALRVYFPLVRRLLESTPSWAQLEAAARAQLLEEAEEAFLRALPPVTEDTMPGELSNVIAGRVANAFDLRGKNFTTDAACASSAAAIEAAVHALQNHECDLALTGGVDHNQGVSMYVKFCRLGALSARGSHPFDARADGFVMGEGAAIFLLKRLDDAQRDGDPIHAVIRGVGASSDGRGRAITAPSVEGQVQCVRNALANAGVGPETIDYVEAHGTGTVVGDAVEVAALRRVFDEHRPMGSVYLGSVKSNIGHLKSASAAAAVLKTVLALREGVIPPSLGFETPAPQVPLPGSPFRVPPEQEPWPRAYERPRRAGVSSFGFGGTNFHLVLEAAPAAEARLWPLLVP
jgi:acyl transferase domain-containing protein